MTRIILAVLALAVAACGGSDTPQSGSDTASEPAKTVDAAPANEANTTPPVSAPAPAAAVETPAATADETKSQDCLDLVAQANFADATPVCLAALAIDPDDTAVQQALATAKSQSASAVSDAATGAATDAATDAAKSNLGDLTGGALGNATD